MCGEEFFPPPTYCAPILDFVHQAIRPMSLTRPSTDLSGCIRHVLSLVNHQAPVCDCTVPALWAAAPRRLIPYRQPRDIDDGDHPRARFVERAFQFDGDLLVSIDQLPLQLDFQFEQLGYRHRILLLVPKDSRLIDFLHGVLDVILNFTTRSGGIVDNGPEHSHERMGSGSCPFGKTREVECGNGHGRRNIKRFYVAAEGNGKSSGGLLADLS